MRSRKRTPAVAVEEWAIRSRLVVGKTKSAERVENEDILQQFAEEPAKVREKERAKAKGTTKRVCAVDGWVTPSRLVSSRTRSAILAEKLDT